VPREGVRIFFGVPLHVTNGDAVVPELVDLAGVPAEDVLVWLEILHDGPVPADLGPGALARVRARHITARSMSHADDVEVSEQTALAMFRERDERLASWPRGSPDPRAWIGVHGFERLLEELPDVRTGLSRTERQILEALAAGPLPPSELFAAVAAHEDPPWIGDATVFDLADDLDPLVVFAGLGPGRPPPYPARLKPGREARTVKLGGEDSNPRSEDQNLVS
jgi:hypothetical protein